MRRDSESSQTRRRQFRSCDQCRKGKRACDIAIPEESTFLFQEKGTVLCVDSCSNCSKTRKTCTLEWLNSRNTPKESRDCQVNSSEKSRQNRILLPKFHDVDQTENLNFVGGLSSLLSSTNSTLEKDFSFSPSTDFSSATDIGLIQEPWLEPSPKSQKDYPTDSLEDENVWGQSPAVLIPSGQYINERFMQNTNCETTDHAARHSHETLPVNRRRKRRNTRRSFFGPSSSSSSIWKSSSSMSTRQSSATHRSESFLNDPSSDSLEYHLASTTNQGFISDGLMKIYHDSVEHALSCWLTDVTCPYTSEAQSKSPSFARSANPMREEWGPAWSNRILQRVCSLDKASSNLRSRQLTVSEDKAAGVVLRKTIMAFAAQWAQSSDRSAGQLSDDKLASSSFSAASRHSTTTMDSDFVALGDDSPKPLEFDRTLQETFWHDARQALHKTSHIESFRLAFANIIFSLVQRPLNDKERHGISREASGVEELNQVVSMEGPPIFLETALRQIFSFRHRIEKSVAQNTVSVKDRKIITGYARGTPTIVTGVLSEEDRQTFNMLFWLGIMFDTLSAAMTQRPLVVSDEDSDVLPQEPPSNIRPTKINLDYFEPALSPTAIPCLLNKDASNLWDSFLLEKQSPRRVNRITRWPCSYESAASVLSDAAPIKVLYFRKVTRLQTLMARHVRHQKLELAIHEALQINEYWNTHFAPFFRDCINHHDSLPARIQSWYVVLAGHWHLAGLLLADIIEEIDDSRMGLDAERSRRASTRLVSNLRIHNSYSVSDLGRCSSPRQESSFSQAKEFHFAINKGALLTEPWTEVLIRSFSKAGSVLLELLPNPDVKPIYSAEKVESPQSRCENCIEALWHIGKKSDMALLASSVLSNALLERLRHLQRAAESCLVDTGLTSQQFEHSFEGCETFSFTIPNDSTSGFLDNQFLWDGIPT